ncbi:MAG: GNAT family N-acetyltransferase [Candidatus Sericytochromatia bacterium]
MLKNARVISLHNKEIIENFLRKNTDLNIYQIGDLDDFFWDSTLWLGLEINDKLEELILIYISPDLPVLLNFSNDYEKLECLIKKASYYLPNKFYSHLSPEVDNIFTNYKKQFNGKHLKMSLKYPDKLDNIDISDVNLINKNEVDSLNYFYNKSYPENWFDFRMLETNQYFGIKEKDSFISVAGIHVYSEKYQVASLGNITTLHEYRGKGLAKKVTAKLCSSLIEKGIKNIGLNVLASNINAIKCYSNLGFEIIAEYNEILFEKN